MSNMYVYIYLLIGNLTGWSDKEDMKKYAYIQLCVSLEP